MNIAVALCISIAPMLGAAVPSFSEEMDFLNQVPADNEERVVDAVRQFALLQFALIDWDRDIATQLNEDPATRDEAQGRLDSAIARASRIKQAYQTLLERYPRNARALNYYGEYMYDYGGNRLDAVRYWKEAIASDPKLTLPYNNLGIHYSHNGQFAFALENYDKAIGLDPKNPDFKFNLAQMYFAYTPDVAEELKWEESKVYREGMKLSKAAAELKPLDFKLQQDYATNFYVAERFEITPDWADAAAAWRRARSAAHDNAELFYSWLNEARAWIRKPDKAKAEACLLEAQKIIPGSEVAARLLDKLRAGEIGEGPTE